MKDACGEGRIHVAVVVQCQVLSEEIASQEIKEQERQRLTIVTDQVVFFELK
jgi:hypothetical protein